MPLEVYSSDDALTIAHANKAFREWPNRQHKNRVEPIGLPKFEPSFHLVPGEKIFTIGSCFARNIEAELEKLGFDVVVRGLLDNPIVRADDPLISAMPNVRDVPSAPSIVNKYTPHSILNELRWALEPDVAPYPDPGAYYEVSPEKYVDANMTNSPQGSLDRTRQRRKTVLEKASEIRECRIVVITPGFIESWWDNVLKDYVNLAPPIPYMKRNPGRFELHVLNYQEVTQAFDETHALLQRHLKPDFRIIFTVSPVPLHVTFRPMDVMVANAYSKSVLRAAAEEFCQHHDNVDYFPSYESFMCSNRQVAWENDLRHPTQALVKANVHRMIEAYMSISLPGDDPEDLVRQFETSVQRQLKEANSEIAFLREENVRLSAEKRELDAQRRRVKQLEAQCDAQTALIDMTQAQLKLSQDTTARYLRQILERDGLLVPSQAAGSGAE